jgi:SAM-dependent methyltransferase
MPRINNEKFYTNAIKLHGQSARGLNWTSSAHQSIRFDKILELLPKDLSSSVVVDAGCGFGDFYLHLRANGRTPHKYIGIDSLKEMCELASRKTDQEIQNRDICKDKLPAADYYICSGALNILTPFETVQFIQNCYKASKKGFIFNVLHGDKESDTYNYLSTHTIKNIAQELKVNRVIMQEDYLENDITCMFI